MTRDTISLKFALLLLYLTFYYILYVPFKDIIRKTLLAYKNIHLFSQLFKLHKNC